MLQVLCKPAREKGLVHRIMTETSSSGIRAYKVGRYTLHRESVTVDSPYGSITVKKMIDPDGRERMAPEYEVCRKIAREQNVPLQKVYADVAKVCSQ